MDTENWDQRFKGSKTLVTNAIISGLDIIDVANIFLDLMQQKAIENKILKPKIIDRMPRVDKRDENFPSNINEFVFYNDFKVRSKMQNVTQLVPVVVTNLHGARRYGQGLVYYEKLVDYLPIIKETIDKKIYQKYNNRAYVDASSIDFYSIDPKYADEALDNDSIAST